MSALTDRIERELMIRGIMLKDFQSAIGITSPAWYKWKDGSTQPRVDRLKQIADYFGLTIPELINNEKAATLPSDGGVSQAAKDLIALCEELDEPSIRYLLKKAQEVREFQQFRDAQE